jgi:hypothetical protein
MNNPIIDEIHGYREEYAARFNYDLKAISLDIKKREEESKRNGWVFIPAPEHQADEPAPPADDIKPRQAAA